MNWPRKLGVSLVLLGALLLGIYLVPTIYGTVMSHLAIAQFRAQSSTNSLWDSARIRAYKRTLAISFAPPEAILRVPRVGIEVPVLEGTSDAILNRGVGHIPGTALPGNTGNLAITGHRDGFFRPLKDVVAGDIIEVQRAGQSGNAAQQTDRYVVSSIKIVSPSDTSVLHPTTDSTLTLVTCYPFYYVGAAPQRYIVQANLLPVLPVTAMQHAPLSVQPTSGE
jgi:sortase A